MRFAAQAGDGDDVPGLIARLTQVREKVRQLEGDLAGANATRAIAGDQLGEIECRARAELADLRRALRSENRFELQGALRASSRADSSFYPLERGNRRGWLIRGRASLCGFRTFCVTAMTQRSWRFVPTCCRRPAETRALRTRLLQLASSRPNHLMRAYYLHREGFSGNAQGPREPLGE